jgi:hypothetical protein
MFRARGQSGRQMDLILRQAQQGRDGCSGTSGRIDQSATKVAEWVFRCLGRKLPPPLYGIGRADAQYALIHFFQIYRSGHGPIRSAASLLFNDEVS